MPTQAQQADYSQIDQFKKLLANVETLASQGTDEALKECRALLSQAATLSVPDNIKQRELARVSPSVQSLYIITNENAKQEAYVHAYIEPNMKQAAAELAAKRQTPEMAKEIVYTIQKAHIHTKRHHNHLKGFDLKCKTPEELKQFIIENYELAQGQLKNNQDLQGKISSMSAAQLAEFVKTDLTEQKELIEEYKRIIKALKITAKKDEDPQKRHMAQEALKHFENNLTDLTKSYNTLSKAATTHDKNLKKGKVIISSPEDDGNNTTLLTTLYNAEEAGAANNAANKNRYGKELQDDQNPNRYIHQNNGNAY